MKVEVDGVVSFDYQITSPVTLTNISFYASPNMEQYPLEEDEYPTPENQQYRNFKLRSFDFPAA